MGNEEVGNDYFVVSASRTAKRNINQLGSRLRKRIDRLLPAPFRPEKESAEETDAGEEGGVEGGVPGGVPGGVVGGVVGGVIGGVLGGVPGGVLGGTQDEPILVVGDVRPPELIVRVQPEYPEMARRARIEGKVILEAIINAQGDVENVRVLRSIPLLDNSAIAAVKKWKYKPAVQHGRPVKVFFTVVVTFSLR